MKDSVPFQVVSQRFRNALKVIQSHLMENKKKRDITVNSVYRIMFLEFYLALVSEGFGSLGFEVGL